MATPTPALLSILKRAINVPRPLALVLGLTLGLGGCWWLPGFDRPQPQDPAPAPEPPGAAEPGQPAEAPPTAETPTTAPSVPGATLPDALVQEWEPLSNVLLTFGPMTVTANQVEWGSGQVSDYTVISTTEEGFLLALHDNPSFYDTPNPYIRLMPNHGETGEITSLEVAFFDTEANLQADEYIMYGSYF
jgi:hypothetical protein